MDDSGPVDDAIAAGIDARRRAAAHVVVPRVGEPVLDTADEHHLIRVLRLRAGETVSVTDGAGLWRLCALAGAGAGLEPVSEVVEEPRADPLITVGFAPTKGERPEWAVAKLTELGVDRIIPLITTRSVVRWDDARAERHLRRWGEIARQAAMQSRRVRLPTIDAPSPLSSVAAIAALTAVLAVPGGSPPTLARPTVLIGPEGGWSPEEEALVGARVGLGPQILRAETATVAAAALYVALRAGMVGEPRSA